VNTESGPAGQVFRGVRHILARRRAVAGLHAAYPCQILRPEPPGLFAFRRAAPTGAILCLFNVTESWQHLPETWARGEGATRMHDLLSDEPVGLHHGNIALPPYARVWLA
jgi:amylosucrase